MGLLAAPRPGKHQENLDRVGVSSPIHPGSLILEITIVPIPGARMLLGDLFEVCLCHESRFREQDLLTTSSQQAEPVVVGLR